MKSEIVNGAVLRIIWIPYSVSNKKEWKYALSFSDLYLH